MGAQNNQNANEVQNQVANNETKEVQNVEVKTTIEAVKCFDSNVTLVTSGEFTHTTEKGDEETNNLLYVSREKAKSLINDLAIFPNINLPDFAFSLLVNTKIKVSKRQVIKGEIVNGYTYENDGYHYDIKVLEQSFNNIQKIVFNKVLDGILNDEYKKAKKEVEIPSFK